MTVGTILAGSHIRLDQWWVAIELICGGSSGVSALELQRRLGLKSYRSALFLAKKLRWAMTQPPLAAAVGRRADRKLHMAIGPRQALELLLRVKAAAGMPRPGANRQKSVWAEVEEELAW